MLWDMRDLSSPTRDQARTPCSGTTDPKPLDCPGSLTTVDLKLFDFVMV